jgi:hypothetical protein
VRSNKASICEYGGERRKAAILSIFLGELALYTSSHRVGGIQERTGRSLVNVAVCSADQSHCSPIVKMNCTSLTSWMNLRVLRYSPQYHTVPYAALRYTYQFVNVLEGHFYVVHKPNNLFVGRIAFPETCLGCR